MLKKKKSFKLPKLGTPLERTVERAFVRKVEALGCRTRKMNGLGNADWPDRMVVGPLGSKKQIAFVEIKRLNEVPTDNQHICRNDLRERGFDARWGYNAQVLADWIKSIFKLR